MPPAVRRMLAVLTGLLAAFVVIMLVQLVSGKMYPAPPGVDLRDPEAMRAFLAGLPISAYLMVLLSYALGALVGGWVAAWRAPAAWPLPPAGIALLLTVASLMNLRALPHPTWFWAANLAAVILLPFAGGWLVQRRDPVAGGTGGGPG